MFNKFPRKKDIKDSILNFNEEYDNIEFETNDREQLGNEIKLNCFYHKSFGFE